MYKITRLFHRAAMDFDKMKKRNAYIDQFKKADMFKVKLLKSLKLNLNLFTK